MSFVDALCLEGGTGGTSSSVGEPEQFLTANEERWLSEADVVVDEESCVLQNLPPQLLKNYGALSQLTNATSSVGTATTVSSATNSSFLSSANPVAVATTTSSFAFETVQVPLKLRPFVKRLQDLPSDEELTEEEIYSILFIIRVADAMLKASYASFLTQSLVNELREKLKVQDLEVEMETAATRWTYQQGAIMAYHRFGSDYDGYAMQQLSRIALGVLEDSITVTEGLQKIQACEDRIEGCGCGCGGGGGRGLVPPFQGLERWNRQYPGRIFVIPLLASTGAVVYFDANVVDFGVCWVTGTVAGLIQYICSKQPQLAGIEEIMIAIATALLSTLSTIVFPGAACFRAQVLGTLFCFLYGISFVLSLYEITQNMVMVGFTRFCLSTVKSFAMAFGVAIGLWAAGYGGPDRFEHTTTDCSANPYQIDEFRRFYFYPVMACGALMHLRVSPKHWPICLITQLLMLRLQFILSTDWKQPLFVSNFVPAFAATLTAHILIVVLHKLNLTELAVKPTAILIEKLKRRKDNIKEETTPFPSQVWPSSPASLASPNHVLRFVDTDSYRPNIDRFQYQRSDLWFCLVPSLYLLAPPFGERPSSQSLNLPRNSSTAIPNSITTITIQFQVSLPGFLSWAWGKSLVFVSPWQCFGVSLSFGGKRSEISNNVSWWWRR